MRPDSALAKANLTKADVTLLIPHQANKRIIDAAANYLDMPGEKVVSNIHEYGNTSAASIPIALSESVRAGRMQRRRRDRVRRIRRRTLVGRRRLEVGSVSASARSFRDRARRPSAWASTLRHTRRRARDSSIARREVLGYDLLALQKRRARKKDCARRSLASRRSLRRTSRSIAPSAKRCGRSSARGIRSASFAVSDRTDRCRSTMRCASWTSAAQAMQDAAELAAGGMSAVLGSGSRTRFAPSSSACATKPATACTLANFNSPTQIVISGDFGAVRAAGDAMLAAGAKRVVPLNVSGAWHSELMQPAVERFRRRRRTRASSRCRSST